MISTATEENNDSSEPDERPDHDVIVLAAGRGTRMQSDLPKILHPLAGLPMAAHVQRAAAATNPLRNITVVNHETNDIRKKLDPTAFYAIQPESDGTGGAVLAGLAHLSAAARWVLVVNGDVPLMETATLNRLLAETREREPLIAIMTFTLPDAAAYGRLQRDANGNIINVIEAADDMRTPLTQPQFAEINSGIYCFDAEWLRMNIGLLERSASGEYYLTSLIETAASTSHRNDPVVGVPGDAESLIGVDDRVRLAEAERVLRQRINTSWMRRGVTLVDPATTYIDITVTIGRDTRIEPGAMLRGATVIGESVTVGSGSVIQDSDIGSQVHIKQSWIESSRVAANVHIGPFAHLRPGTIVAGHVHIGNYVETKNARIGVGSRIGHFSYVGDATLGEQVNIGAGTITCNYDGVEKHETQIGSNAFIGSDTMLVAPVEVGEGARTGAGAVVTRSVPPGKTVVGIPARQVQSKHSNPSGIRET